MRERPDPTALSPRALAWLRGGRSATGAGGWVPRVPERAADGRYAAETVELEAREWDDDVGVARRGDRGGSGRWVRLPSALGHARWQPGRAAVLGVALVTVVAVLLLGLRVAWARSEVGDVVAPGGGSRAGPSGVSAGAVRVGVPSGAAPLGGAPGGASAPPSPSATGTPPGVLVVHVVGQVRRPGLQRLPVGSRVSDAVEAAGGASRAADLAALNLARLLVDGEQVRVPKPGEVVTDGGTGGVGGGGAGGSPPGGAKVSLSTADVAALDSLPGIGPVLAQRIVDWRTEHGRFTSVDELGEVSGIGEKLLAQVRPLVTP
jgi:competence protein ComEA